MTINNINSNLSNYFTNSILSILSTNNIPHTYNPTTEEITTPYIIIDLNNKDSFFNYIEIFPSIYMAAKMEMEGGEE